MAQRITIAHSPDADDAFMFYALAQGKVSDPDLECVHVLQDIQSLNQRARQGQYEVTAISFHAYPYIADTYAILPHGASIGDGYGPMIVAREAWGPGDLGGRRIAVPGTLTTAFLVLQLWKSGLEHVVIPFDQIMDAVVAGRVDAGLIIHEGQITYASLGLRKVLDLGAWWLAETGLPLPLGGNVIRKDLGADRIRRISSLVRQSIQYGLTHRGDALEYAMQFSRDMDRALVDRFVGMYVNDLTLDYGERGYAAVRRLLTLGYERGLIPHRVEPEFTD